MARFAFLQRQVSSPGMPARYDVMDGLGAGAAGQRVGRVIYDAVMNRWSFLIDSTGPVTGSGGVPELQIGVDATEISAFIATLALPQRLVQQ